MILFFLSSILYIGMLLVIKPAPSSLKARPLSLFEHFRRIWASLLSGVFILVVFLVTSQFGFLTVDEHILGLFSLNNDMQYAAFWPIQAVTHSFVHGNLIHLLSNVAGLGLASVYERRVGARRFFAVLLAGCMASIPSVFLYSDPTSVCGISGGVFGLAAAYITDEDELTIKEWATAILLFSVLFFVFTLQPGFKGSSNTALELRVDHIGHVMGAIGAIVYCRFNPRLKKESIGKIDNEGPGQPIG
ncbi:rhomboid family intramembrane serine protease [Desulfoluna spongiiphila]|uniref:rhomboid family intramembrane serine protease n=1 Tax=Desulfoluna spongiiphila TaxID=419481 RepID=UPI0012568BB4|nr:rhomboid family intramembrane serine protease [Desulfoluna spongiiphila]VVS95517.1 peptidase s54 rhomboid domain [Desulfoluna spongiiphila]